MATDQDTIAFLLDQLAALRDIAARKMFGEYCLYVSGKPVGLVCDDQLFLKPTAAGKHKLESVIEGTPYPGAKPHLLITADQWEDSVWLCELVAATAREVPIPKPRVRKTVPGLRT